MFVKSKEEEDHLDDLKETRLRPNAPLGSPLENSSALWYHREEKKQIQKR